MPIILEKSFPLPGFTFSFVKELPPGTKLKVIRNVDDRRGKTQQDLTVGKDGNSISLTPDPGRLPEWDSLASSVNSVLDKRRKPLKLSGKAIDEANLVEVHKTTFTYNGIHYRKYF